MARIIGRTVFVLSTIALVGSTLLLVRSFWRADQIAYSDGGTGDTLASNKGRLVFLYHARVPAPRPGFFYLSGQTAPVLGLDTNALGFAFQRFGPRGKSAMGTVPTLSIVLASAIYPAWFLLTRGRDERRRRERDGLCLTCGYDLRASDGRCPECGHLIASA